MTSPAIIDRLVRHAEILNLKGDCDRLKDKDLGSPPPANAKGPRNRMSGSVRRR